MDTITATTTVTTTTVYTLPDGRTLTVREHKHLRPRRFTLAQLAGWFASNDGGSHLRALLRHRRPRHSIPLRRDLPAAYQPRTGDKIQVAA
jgi:hypothetical protein